MEEIIARYIHFIGIIVLASTLVAEHVLLKGELDTAQLRRVSIIDAAYGIAALVVLSSGLTLWLWLGKPAGFYTDNPVFLAKLGSFILMGLVSIRPTVFLLRSRGGARVTVPKPVINHIRIELSLLVLIPLLAVLMAKGVGLGE